MVIEVKPQFTGFYSKWGNSKIGKNVGAINRPVLNTCPGASDWCKDACYADKGQSRMKQPKYKTSAIDIPGRLSDIVRFHVSGDFDSVPYIEWCIDIANRHPNTLFWAYTRSYTIPDLLPSLERLKALDNVQLFASTDPTMNADLIPNGWRVAFIEGDNRFRGPLCMFQECTDLCTRVEGECKGGKYHKGLKNSCLQCGFCFKGRSKNIMFRSH